MSMSSSTQNAPSARRLAPPSSRAYSLPGWIVLLANGLPCRVLCRVSVQALCGVLCRVLCSVRVGLLCIVCVGFVYSFRLKLYISQLTENQRNAWFNVGFVCSLYSFFVSPFIYV